MNNITHPPSAVTQKQTMLICILFYQVSQGYVVYRDTCQLYDLNATESSSSSSSDSGDMRSGVFGILKPTSVQYALKKSGCHHHHHHHKNQCRAHLHHVHTSNPTVCFSQSTSKCTIDHISRQQRKISPQM